MDDGISLKRLEEFHSWLTAHLVEMSDKCKTDAERKELGEQFDLAGRNLVEARNRIFDEGRSEVKDIQRQLRNAEEKIKNMIKTNEQTATVLKGIARAVDLGKQLVSLGTSSS